MDANARTGMRGIEWTDSKVLGAYGRDELNDNGERLLTHATDNKLALLNTYYATPARGISYKGVRTWGACRPPRPPGYCLL